jgi:hypothetical protein
MRFYAGQHRFYCGVDLDTRTLSLCVVMFGPAAGTPPAEAAEVNPAGLSGAITGFVPLQPSSRDLRVSPLPPRLLTIGAINGFGWNISAVPFSLSPAPPSPTRSANAP